LPQPQPGVLIAETQNERHSYEKCQYEEFKLRVAKMDEIRAAKGGARSN
jgi:NADH dehydrogenase (ubiquinone) 1 beta subcomplex subunit 7